MFARIISLTIYRVGLASLLLLYQLLALLVSFPIISFRGVLFMVAGVSILTLLYLIYLHFHARTKSDLSGFVFSQFIVDILLVSILVMLTGGEESNLRFAYLMIIVLSAMFLDKISIYVIMTVSLGFFFFALSAGPFLLAFEAHADYQGGLVPTYHPVMVGQTLLCFLTALLSGFMQSAYLSNRRALLREEERVRSLIKIRRKIVEALPSGLILCDQAGLLVFINRMGQKILQTEGEDLSGKLVWSMLKLEPPGEVQGVPLPRFERRVTVGGSRKILGISYRSLELETGRPGYMIVFQDLTKIKLLESHQLLEDKMAAIGKVAAGVAHEIRNPLASISGGIQVLKEVLPEDKTAIDLADIVARETSRLNEIISQFLAYARPGAPPKFEALDFAMLIEDYLKLVKNDSKLKKVRFVVHFPEESCIILGDRTKLYQVLWNLVKNSYNASENDPCIEIGCHLEKETVILTLSDNGIGMNEEQLKDLFTPFQSFSKSGTGLGMSIVFDIVKMHHARIEVQSQPNQGTKVTLKFEKYEE